MSLVYSIETLIHYACGCGATWTRNNGLPSGVITCPDCGTSFEEYANATKMWNYCGMHQVYFNVMACPVCSVRKLLTNNESYAAGKHEGYLAGLHDKPKLMELPDATAS